MLEVVPHTLTEIKNDLKRKAIDEFGLVDAEFEGSNTSQLINLLAYANVINNTNLTFGVNEMFITQAQDRINVNKHAKQMGYSYKRKQSFQYKIKLHCLETGVVTLDKYSTFSGNGNNYIYLGDGLTDTYGTFIYTSSTNNEDNNNVLNIINSDLLVNEGTFIISDGGVVCEVLTKDIESSENNLLLKTITGGDVPLYSSTPQSVYLKTGYNNDGYMNLDEIGKVSTYSYDKLTNIFKVQIIPNTNYLFPVSLEEDINTTVINSEGILKLNEDTNFEIYKINSLTLSDGTNEDIIDIDSLIINKNNIEFSPLGVSKVESFEDNNITILDPNTHKVRVTLSTSEDFTIGSINTLYNGISYINEIDVIVGNDVDIKAHRIENREKDLNIVNGIVQKSDIVIDEMDELLIIGAGGNVEIVGEKDVNYKLENNVISLLKDGEVTSDYDSYTVEINYFYYIPLEEGTIEVHYTYPKDIVGLNVIMNYSYIKSNGYLNGDFYFSDLRGLYENGTETFVGFKSFDYNSTNNILSFKIDDDTKENYYPISYNELIPINEAMVSPFKLTRFSLSEPILDGSGEVTGYKSYNPSTTFLKVNKLLKKDSLEIIVKEGEIRKWDEESDQSIINSIETNGESTKVYKYPELSFNVNMDMINAGYFILDEPNIEDNGLEMFITRVLPNGDIEDSYPWVKRDKLLSEDSSGYDRTFVVTSDDNYENYLNVFTKYAGTGTPLELDMEIKLNILTSKGELGYCNALMKSNNPKFETKYYIEESNTPLILHINGSDIETTESIRETAPLFSNTASRAVTKNDYKTICESQPYISDAQIWGGEESVPNKKLGNVMLSFIPYSRSHKFIVNNNKYYLQDAYDADLFFPNFYQITGMYNYNDVPNKEDRAVLFNMLDQYKIITLQLNYVRPIYLDCTMEVNIIKYQFGKTVVDTNNQIFDIIKNFFTKNIEKFDSVFYKSSLIRYIDEELGDEYGLSLSNKFNIPLYDSLTTQKDRVFTQKSIEDAQFDDDWEFVFSLPLPLENIFKSDIILDNIIQQRGEIILENITTIDTDEFLVSGDKIFLELNEKVLPNYDRLGNLIVDSEGNTLAPSIASETINIKIMYNSGRDYFQVGTYIIYQNKKIIQLILNTNGDEHNIGNPDYLDTLEFKTITKSDDTTYQYREAALDRKSFTNGVKKLNLIPVEQNISVIRNVFPRLSEVEFI